jgi:hypothetical protein
LTQGIWQIRGWQLGAEEVYTLPNPNLATQLSPWPSDDGRWLYYIENQALTRYDFERGQSQTLPADPLNGELLDPLPSPAIGLAWGGWVNFLGGLALLFLGLWRVYVQT